MRAGLCLIAMLLTGAAAGAATSSGSAERALRESVAKADPKLTLELIQAAPVDGWYHVSLGGASGYVSADGRYFIRGDMFDVASRKNLTEDGRKGVRLAALRSVRDENAIVFSPPQPKHTITVFTDVDCGFCRKLHSEMKQLNELGIAVRYVAYPRSGPGSESWSTMEAVWCAADRRDALTRAKAGESIARRAGCNTTSVAEQYALGQKLEVSGTPLVLLEDGSAISGYVPAAQLARQLDALSSRDAAKTAASTR